MEMCELLGTCNPNNKTQLDAIESLLQCLIVAVAAHPREHTHLPANCRLIAHSVTGSDCGSVHAPGIY